MARPDEAGVAMRRRDVIKAIAVLPAWPSIVRAQQGDRMRRIGVLIPGASNDPEGQRRVAALRVELQRLGWVESKNIQIEIRWVTPGDPQSSQQFAKELVVQKPDVIVSSSTPPTAAVLQQTRTIPVVFTSVNDPISSGFVASFPRPGGNVTGFIILESTIGGKWLQMLREIAPHLDKVAFLFNQAQAPTAQYYLNSFKAAAESVGFEPITAPVREVSEIESAMAAQSHPRSGGVIVAPDGFLLAHRVEITSLAARYRVPAVYYTREFAVVGGLLSYGADAADSWRRAAGYVDQILKGANPSELPVQAPAKFELVINLKTARALGLEIPPTLLSRADEVIE